MKVEFDSDTDMATITDKYWWCPECNHAESYHPEPYWLIERVVDGIPHWWKRGDGQYSDAMAMDRWTTDANEARHYESKADAEFVMGNQMPGCVATEHLIVG